MYDGLVISYDYVHKCSWFINYQERGALDLQDAAQNKRSFSVVDFRLYPIGTEVARYANKDMVIGGYHIPTGVSIEYISMYVYRSILQKWANFIIYRFFLV